ncbi:MAG: hypothetical protein GY729_08420 [Desulfobacteraceae bacterium]|nr:hypothetical protein [Desulfobacteraceae bacterium]
MVLNRTLWEKKAIAFVTRSHQHLWGKNNEDPLVWLYEQGLKNQFVKQMHLGWNKHSQKRNSQNWGLKEGSLVLPAGIVIPYIIKKNLKSIMIYPYQDKNIKNAVILPGSQGDPMILGNPKKNVAILTNVMDGLYLFQETKEQLQTIIVPDLTKFTKIADTSLFENAQTIITCCCSNKQDIKVFQGFTDLYNLSSICQYKTKKQLTAYFSKMHTNK